jgi:hypothetical protein
MHHVTFVKSATVVSSHQLNCDSKKYYRVVGISELAFQYGTHHSYVLVVHTLRVAENKILKLDLPAKRH